MDYMSDNLSETMLNFEEKLEKAVNFVQAEYTNIRAGRVSGTIVERVTINYHGAITPLRDLATITNEDSRTILVNPWDISIRSEVCRAIASANLGANPIDNGQYIRLIFPALTEEKRRELARQIKDIAEKAKITMRNERRDTIEKAKKIAKEEKFGEDDIKSVESDIQKLLDNYISNLDKLFDKKEAEIMAV